MTDKLVTIANFAFGPDPASEAEMAKLKLEIEGIECFLLGKNFVGTYWLYAGIEGGIKLQVRQSDAARATEILERKAKPEEIEANLPDLDDDLRCPKCSSRDVEYQKFSRIMFLLGILLFRVPLPLLKKTYRCRKCGCVWEENH